MARKPRILLAGGFYHLILRGNGGQGSFLLMPIAVAFCGTFRKGPVASTTEFRPSVL